MRFKWLLLGAVFGLIHGQAQAQTTPPAADTAAQARSLSTEGLRLAALGSEHCGEALPVLERAEALLHDAQVLLKLAECQIVLGKFLRGTDNLKRALAEPLPNGAPFTARQARERAKSTLEAALGRIARVSVTLLAPAPGSAVVVRLDAEELSVAQLGNGREVDPGVHEVTADAPGYVSAKFQVSLKEGERQTLVLALERVPAPPPPAPAAPICPAMPPPLSPAPPLAVSRPNYLAYTFLGSSAALLTAGGITSAVAISLSNNLDCPGNQCAASQQGTLRTANTMSTAATITIALGLGAGAAGGLMLLLDGKRSEPAAEHGKIRAKPWVGLGSVGVNGTF